jgi:hypothetical protein
MVRNLIGVMLTDHYLNAVQNCHGCETWSHTLREEHGLSVSVYTGEHIWK